MTDEMKKAIIAEISEYCEQNNEDWDLMREEALRCWGRKEPMPSRFGDTILDSMQEWFNDNFCDEDFV